MRARARACDCCFGEHSPKYVVAPMVHHSDHAYRLLTRRYGAQLVYTEMFPSRSFIRSESYRAQAFQTCPEDRPLIVQVWRGSRDVLSPAVPLTPYWRL